MTDQQPKPELGGRLVGSLTHKEMQLVFSLETDLVPFCGRINGQLMVPFVIGSFFTRHQTQYFSCGLLAWVIPRNHTTSDRAEREKGLCSCSYELVHFGVWNKIREAGE
jgi:hypothetical protein